MRREMTDLREDHLEALLWLNDRLGQALNVDLSVEADGYAPLVLSAHDKLRHWSQDEEARNAVERLPGQRDDLAGLYQIGDITLDLSGVTLRCTFDFHMPGDT